jgi:hypothetical protein
MLIVRLVILALAGVGAWYLLVVRPRQQALRFEEERRARRERLNEDPRVIDVTPKDET